MSEPFEDLYREVPPEDAPARMLEIGHALIERAGNVLSVQIGDDFIALHLSNSELGALAAWLIDHAEAGAR